MSRLQFADVLHAIPETCDDRATLLVQIARVIDESTMQWGESNRAWLVSELHNVFKEIDKKRNRFRDSLKRTKL